MIPRLALVVTLLAIVWFVFLPIENKTEMEGAFHNLLSDRTFTSTIFGAIVGGVLTIAAQGFAIFEARKQRSDETRIERIGLCASLILKLCAIERNLLRSKQIFDESFRMAQAQGLDLSNPWLFCRAISNYGTPIRFVPQEMAIFVFYKDFDTFNALAGLDDLNNAFVELLKAYREKRETLTAAVAPYNQSWDGGVGRSEIPRDVELKLLPLVFECNQLIEQILALANEHPRVARARDLVNNVQSKHLGNEFRFLPN